MDVIFFIIFALTVAAVGAIGLFIWIIVRSFPQFSLKRLFLLVTLAAVLCAGCVAFVRGFRQLRIDGERMAVGGQRFTRAEAEAKLGRPIVDLPNSEFREISD